MRISVTQKRKLRNKSTETLIGKFKTITAKERIFYANLVKSAISETIVQNLFILEGYKVHKYGMETSLPQMLGCLHSDKSETAIQIKAMPDLVVQTPDLNNVFFVEVKYRSNGQFSINDFKKYEDYPFKSAYFIILSKKTIKCLTYKELMHGFHIDENTDNQLIDRKEFQFTEEIFREYLELMEDLFSNID